MPKQLQEWMDAALDSTQAILADLGCPTELVDLPDPEALESGAYISVDTEEHNFLLALLSGEELQQVLTSKLLGESASSSGMLVRDAMGEISNMIAGLTKTRMAQLTQQELSTGLPVFIQGRHLGTSAARTRIAERTLLARGYPCRVVVIQQQVSGEAVRRLEAEHQLRDSEERQRAILEAVADGVITLNSEGTILSFNSAARRIFGYASGEVLNENIRALLEMHVALGESSLLHSEGTGIRHDASKFPIEVSISSFRLHGDTHYAMIVRDITLREAARRTLEEANQRMFQLSRAAGKAEVAADVLHNVGNVMNSLNTTTSLMMARLKASKAVHLERLIPLLQSQGDGLGEFLTSSERGQKVLPFLTELTGDLSRERADNERDCTFVQKQVDHLKGVIMTQQATAAATAAGFSEEVELKEVVADALAHAWPLIEPFRIRVVEQYESLPRLVTDKNKLQQIVTNLIKNACESMSEQSVTSPQLKITGGFDGQNITLEICDNGAGITPDAMTKLFTHGFTTKKGGHGFGLHGCALYARQLGGQLRAASNGFGEGATFTVRLPSEGSMSNALKPYVLSAR